jgi:hypothetical protein
VDLFSWLELGAAFQRLIPTGERSALQTRIAAMEIFSAVLVFMPLRA